MAGDNLLAGAADTGTEIPEKFFQPEQIEVEKDGKVEKVNFDFDSLQIPEKLTVKKEDGTIDHEKTAKRILASTKKATTSYAELEKKLGKYTSIELAPEKEDGYKLDYTKMPETFKPTAENEKGLLKYFHGLGLNNKQAQGVMDKYASILSTGTEELDKTIPSVAAEFKTAHGENYPVVMKQVTTAFDILADDEDKANLSKLGKDLKITYKTLTKFLAKVGADLVEDKGPGIELGGNGADADELEKIKVSEAYTKADHPEHKLAVKKANELYNKLYSKKK